MGIVAGPRGGVPTNLAPLARLLAYAQGLGLERYLERPKHGVSTLALSLLWLYLAWRGSGRPHHLGQVTEPLLPALLGCPTLPTPRTLSRSLAYFSAKGVREAVEAAYQAELPHRSHPRGRVWVALDAHQLPDWGRGQKQRFQKGWSGSHGRRLRGYRLYLAVDTETGSDPHLPGGARGDDRRPGAGRAGTPGPPDAGAPVGRSGGRLRLHQPGRSGRPGWPPWRRRASPSSWASPARSPSGRGWRA